MPTRFYLPSSGSTPITPAFGGWDESGSADRLKCVTTKIASAMTDKVVAKATTATRALVRQYVSDPIAAQTIVAGTVKGQVRCLESGTNDNLDHVPLLIRVVSNDGNTYRSPAIIALGDYAAAAEFASSLTNRKIADGDATTEVVAQDGDRIVIEIGEKNSGTGSSVSGTLNFGDSSATDLAEDTTTTTANNPWVELSVDIAFAGDETLGPWSDNLNSQQAPMKAAKRITQTTGGSTGIVKGINTVSDEAHGQRFTATADGKLVRARFFINKVGSPTDSVVCKVYADDGSGLPGTLLITSLSIPAAMLSTSSASVPFEFVTPVGVINSGVYHAIVWRTGAGDATNYYSLDGVASDAYAGGNAIKRTGSAGTRFWEDQLTTRDCRFDIEIETANWYKFEIDRDDAVIRAYLSTDQGANWTEQDASNAPAVWNALGCFAVAVQRKGGKFYVVVPATSTTIKQTFPFDSAANTWGTPTSRAISGVGLEQFGLNVAGVCPLFHNYREYSTQASTARDFTFVQVTPEIVSSVPYRRIRVQQGTTNGTLTGAGSTVHYDLRALVNDWRDWTYAFYTKSDSTQIQVATVDVNNTSQTIVGGLSVSAVDQTTKYPIGQGCHFWRDGVNYVGVLYRDGSAVKFLYCESGTPANTESNWLSTTIAAVAPESDTSNPGFVVADNEQGGKLFAFFVDDTTGDMKWCHDSGSFTWTEPQVFESGFDVAGCAGSLSDRTIGMLLRNGSTFALVFRKLDVFF